MSNIKGVKVGNGHGEFVNAIFPGSSQVLPFTATSSQSAALGSQTSLVEVYATQNCHIKVAADPTAVADGTCFFIPLGVARQICVTGGEKIAAIRNTADGNLYITEAVSL